MVTQSDLHKTHQFQLSVLGYLHDCPSNSRVGTYLNNLVKLFKKQANTPKELLEFYLSQLKSGNTEINWSAPYLSLLWSMLLEEALRG